MTNDTPTRSLLFPKKLYLVFIALILLNVVINID